MLSSSTLYAICWSISDSENRFNSGGLVTEFSSVWRVAVNIRLRGQCDGESPVATRPDAILAQMKRDEW